MTTIILAILIGAAFGFVLDRIGASDPNWIGGMLTLRRLHLMKTILLAIGIGSVLMFGGQMLGLVDVGHMSIKATYIGVIIGGVLLGIGWAASGYCPGTGVVGAASGRVDAMFFVVGGLMGAGAYMLSYPLWQASGLLDSIAGGKTTLGQIPGAEYPALIPVSGDWLGIGVGLVFIAVAIILPDSLAGGGERARVPAE